MTGLDTFHAHLDECRRCREDVFNLCPIGLDLAEKAAIDDSMFRGLIQWNRVVQAQEDNGK